MKTKQLVVLIGILGVALVIAIALSYIPVQVPAHGPPGEARVDSTLRSDLRTSGIISSTGNAFIRASEGNYYLLDTQYESEGPGGWALVKRAGAAITVIDSGNKGEYETSCALLTTNAVPVSVFKYCTRDSGDILNRQTNTITTQEAIWKEEGL